MFENVLEDRVALPRMFSTVLERRELGASRLEVPFNAAPLLDGSLLTIQMNSYQRVLDHVHVATCTCIQGPTRCRGQGCALTIHFTTTANSITPSQSMMTGVVLGSEDVIVKHPVLRIHIR